MLLWQQKNMPKRAFWIQLLVIISFLHVIGCIIFLLQSAHEQMNLHVFAHQNYDLNAEVVLLPCVKEVKQVVCTPPSASIQSVFEIKEVTVVEEVKTACGQTVPQKTKETESVPADKPKRDKLVSEAQEMFSETSTRTLGRKQFDALQVQRAIAQELKKVWHPPQGLSQDLETILLIEINPLGDVASIETKQQSGVLVYDIHARTAVCAMRLPRACWGKQITITFKQ